MSSVSSPVHRYSSDIDNVIYDQNFTADISNKMRVPRTILVTGEGKDNADEMLVARIPPPPLETEIRGKSNMRVPDRIIVAGHEQHEGAKAPPRELHLEQILTPQPSVIRVETPPRVLTLEDHFFPTVDEDSDNETTDNKVVPNKTDHHEQMDDDHMNVITRLSEVLPSQSSDDILSPTEELQTLRRHLIKLNRRVMCLEQESQMRQQKEMIIYSFGVAYFVLKALLWLHRHW